MTRINITKLTATALALASLGLASSAQAAEDLPVDGNGGTAITDTGPQTGQGAPPPAGDGGTAVADTGAEEEIDYTSPQYFKSKEARDRFERYCNMKDAEPSHSDKKFCEDFRKHNGTTTTTTSGNGRPDNGKGPLPICERPEHPYYEKYCHKPDREKPEYEQTGYEKPVEKAKKALGKELPYTGLEMWQLGLIGIVLSGGGLGARRLLAS